jgi:ribonuclease R
MLPHALADEACSLVPGVDRLAVTAEVRLDGKGAPRSAAFYRSDIRSDARLDYEQLDEMFAGRASPPPEVAEPLSLARRAAAALAERRPVGALEPEFDFDREGGVTAARGVAQTEAHRLIEHLMILANERVAELLEQRRASALYRVHEQPDPERVRRLLDQLATLEVPTPPAPDRISPSEAGALVGDTSRLVAAEARRRGHGRDAYASLVLRSLKQAYYLERNLGHAGLGSPAYCHFTSPIRRYPDLIAHRALLAELGAGEDRPDPSEVREAGWRCSEREREAMRIERRADRVCASFLLERELFENGWDTSFEGEVSGLVSAGAFVRFGGELGDVYEGFVPARTLRGERFDLNETETALVGRRTGREVRLGDPLAVTVSSVEPARGRADLEPAYGDQST